MSDIPPWRRKMQPTRARTPAPEPEEPDMLASPKRGLKPKLSSYFAAHGSSTNLAKPEVSYSRSCDDLFTLKMSQRRIEKADPCPDPSAEGLIESVMCRLLSDPYTPLEASFSGSLLRIFKSYRTINDERQQLQAQVTEQDARQKSMMQQLRSAQKQWHEERQEYKGEVKRLELLLAKGKRGLAEVTLARQDSVLRHRNSATVAPKETYDDGLETIFEFLEKTKRYEDKAWSSQRAAFRTRARPASPSKQMRRLSQQLASKKSTTNIHEELAFGTPPNMPQSSLVEASQSEAKGFWNESKDAQLNSFSEPKTSFSDDTISTFSCLGDLLPDEGTECKEITRSESENEITAMKRIANAIARRRNLDQAKLLPKLLGLFEPVETTPTAVTTARMMNRPLPPLPRLATGPNLSPKTSLSKQPSLIAKASGFLQRLKSQNGGESPLMINKRFSFEAGDDHRSFDADMPTQEVTPELRKSFSMSSLSAVDDPNYSKIRGHTLSPVLQSPTTSAAKSTSEPRRVSRIPTPKHDSLTRARPRRQRESSSSSLLTAIDHSKRVSQKNNYISSPAYNSADINAIESMEPAPRISSWARQVRLASNDSLEENIAPLDEESSTTTDSSPSKSANSSPSRSNVNHMRRIMPSFNHATPRRHRGLVDMHKENSRPTDPATDAGVDPELSLQ